MAVPEANTTPPSESPTQRILLQMPEQSGYPLPSTACTSVYCCPELCHCQSFHHHPPSRVRLPLIYCCVCHPRVEETPVLQRFCGPARASVSEHNINGGLMAGVVVDVE